MRCPHLDKGDLACADVTLCVSDDHLAVVLQRALLTQHVVDTCHCLVPLVVITIATHTKHSDSSTVKSRLKYMCPHSYRVFYEIQEKCKPELA